MVATKSSCSTAILAEKHTAYRALIASNIELFTSAFAVKYYKQMMVLVQNKRMELH